MSEHKHEPLIGNDGIIRCRTCGQILPSAEIVISKVTSAVRARKVLDEIAVAGRYRATGFSGKFIVYSKDKDGLREELTAEKLGEREFVVTKRITSE